MLMGITTKFGTIAVFPPSHTSSVTAINLNEKS